MDECRLPFTHLTFLYAGKLEPRKGVELLVKAFLSIRHPLHRLIIVGNGVLEARLKEMCSGNSLVKFIDFQNQSMMPVVYMLGDVFVLPIAGPGETWGLGVNEAMACGRAVVVSDKAGCAVDLVEERCNGYVFAANNVGALMKKMRGFEYIADAFDMGARSMEMIKGYNLGVVSVAIEGAVS